MPFFKLKCISQVQIGWDVNGAEIHDRLKVTPVYDVNSGKNRIPSENQTFNPCYIHALKRSQIFLY